MKTEWNLLQICIIFTLVICAIVTIVFVMSIFFNLDLAISSGLDTEKTGHIGDFFGGVVGSLLSFLAVLLLMQSQKQQAREFREQISISKFELTSTIFKSKIEKVKVEYDEKHENLLALKGVIQMIFKGEQKNYKNFEDWSNGTISLLELNSEILLFFYSYSYSKGKNKLDEFYLKLIWENYSENDWVQNFIGEIKKIEQSMSNEGTTLLDKIKGLEFIKSSISRGIDFPYGIAINKENLEMNCSKLEDEIKKYLDSYNSINDKLKASSPKPKTPKTSWAHRILGRP